MSELFFTADTHFGHAAIIRHSNRPFVTADGMPDVENMSEMLIQKWNEIITNRDMIVIIGDFAWKDHAKYLSRLRGKKILIRGNHDKMSREVEKQFTAVYDMRMIRMSKGHKAFCCHYCMDSWPDSHHGAYHLYGHSHGRKQESEGRLRFDVGVDVWDFKPVHESVIVAKMDKYFKKFDKDPEEGNKIHTQNLEFNREVLHGFNRNHCNGNDHC